MKQLLFILLTTLFLLTQQSPIFANTFAQSAPETRNILMQAKHEQTHPEYSPVTWIWSLFIPGVSQIIMGESEKGYLMLGGMTGLYFGRMMLMGGYYRPMMSGAMGGLYVLTAMIGIHIWSVIDAFILNIEKNKEAKSRQSMTIRSPDHFEISQNGLSYPLFRF